MITAGQQSPTKQGAIIMDRHIIRQGDVLLIPADAMPEGLVVCKRESGRVVLAHGEVTGHCHAISDPDVTMFAKADLDEMADRFLRVESEHAELTHDEHHTLTIPAGDWIVRRQREYTPEAIVRVAD